MNCSFIFVVSASNAVLGSAALAESPGIARRPACERAATNEKAMESLRANAQAARRELRLVIKGPAASLDKMKIVELDELIDRLQNGDPAPSDRELLAASCPVRRLTTNGPTPSHSSGPTPKIPGMKPGLSPRGQPRPNIE
jgi:hypothetical protein